MTDKLILMVGCPGSGKSTWIEKQIPRIEEDGKTTVVVSRDYIRKSMVGDTNDESIYFSREKEVFEEFVRQINEAMEIGIDTVFVDATHISVGSRRKILTRLIPDPQTKLAIAVMDTPAEVCKERNAQRTGFAHVPDKGMSNMIKGYKKPDFSEFPDNSYGFKEIYIVDVK